MPLSRDICPQCIIMSTQASMKHAYVTPLPTVVNPGPANGSTMRNVAAKGNSTRNTLMRSTWMVRRRHTP